MRFRFIDNPSKQSAGEWDRIVCIIAGTQPWQFRGWRITDPAVLFSKSCNCRVRWFVVLGVFMWFNEMPVPVVVKGWNVHEVCVGGNKEVWYRLIVMYETWMQWLEYNSGTWWKRQSKQGEWSCLSNMFVKKQRWDDDYVRNHLWKFTIGTHSHQTDIIIFIPSLYRRNQGRYSNGNISWSLLCWRRTAWIKVWRSFCWGLSVEYKVSASVINWVICLTNYGHIYYFLIYTYWLDFTRTTHHNSRKQRRRREKFCSHFVRPTQGTVIWNHQFLWRMDGNLLIHCV